MSFDIAIPPGTLEALGLYLVRTSVLVLAAPILGMVSGFSGYKVALIALVSFLLFTTAGATPLATPPGPLEFGLLAMREVLIGFFLAFLLQLVLLAVRVGGSLVGHEMGFAMAEVVDPQSGIRTPLVTRAYESLFLLGLLAVDGHHWLMRALARSFERAPVGELALGDGLVGAVQTLFGEMFSAGITFAAPVMVLLVLASVGMGLFARLVPQLNVLEVGFSVRIGLALFALMLFAPTLAPGLERLFVDLELWLDTGLDLLGG